MVCHALVAGGRLLGIEQQAMHPDAQPAATMHGQTYIKFIFRLVHTNRVGCGYPIVGLTRSK